MVTSLERLQQIWAIAVNNSLGKLKLLRAEHVKFDNRSPTRK